MLALASHISPFPDFVDTDYILGVNLREQGVKGLPWAINFGNVLVLWNKVKKKRKG